MSLGLRSHLPWENKTVAIRDLRTVIYRGILTLFIIYLFLSYILPHLSSYDVGNVLDLQILGTSILLLSFFYLALYFYAEETYRESDFAVKSLFFVALLSAVVAVSSAPQLTEGPYSDAFALLKGERLLVSTVAIGLGVTAFAASTSERDGPQIFARAEVYGMATFLPSTSTVAIMAGEAALLLLATKYLLGLNVPSGLVALSWTLAFLSVVLGLYSIETVRSETFGVERLTVLAFHVSIFVAVLTAAVSNFGYLPQLASTWPIWLFLSFVSGVGTFLIGSRSPTKRIVEVPAKYRTGLLVLLVLVGFSLRVWRVTELSVWADEVQVYLTAENIAQTGIPVLDSGYLYARDLAHLYIVALFFKVFGASELTLRIPSVVAGTAMIVAVYYLVKEFAGSTPALVGALFTAVHPWLVAYSRYGRSYIISLLFVTVYLYLFASFLNRGHDDQRLFGKMVAVGALAIFTHQTGQITAIMSVFLALYIFYAEDYPSKLRDWYEKRSVSKEMQGATFVSGTLLGSVLASKVVASQSYFQYTAAAQAAAESGGGPLQTALSYVPLGATFRLGNLLYISNPLPLLSVLFFVLLVASVASVLLGYQSREMKLLAALSALVFFPSAFAEESVHMSRAYLYIVTLVITVAVVLIYRSVQIANVSVQGRIPRAGVLLIAVATLSLVTVPLVAQSVDVASREHGESINPHYSAAEVFSYRQDHRSTYEYLNAELESDETVIAFGNPKAAPIYLKDNISVDYYVWTGTNHSIGGEHYYIEGTEIVSEFGEFRQLMESEDNFWIVSTYSISDYPGLFHINGQFKDYIREKCPVFQSDDPYARVYHRVNGTYRCD